MLEERTLATAARDEVHNPLPGPNVLGRNAISSGNENWKDMDTNEINSSSLQMCIINILLIGPPPEECI